MNEKEKLRQEILNCCNSSLLQEFDLSLFGDEDPDVFEKVVSFDSYHHNYYAKLSDVLKHNKNIVVKAAKCLSNIELIPKEFFNDKDVIKSVLYARYEKHIPEKYLTEDMVNYMFLTCPRCSTEIQPFIDQHLKKETLITVLKHHNEFLTRCIKGNSHACIDKIHIPEKMFQDADIVKLLFAPHFRLVEDNPLVNKELILSLVHSEYAIEYIPDNFVNDFDLIKQCLSKKDNYKIADNFALNKLIKNDSTLIKELIEINPKILTCHHFEITFQIFNELIQDNIEHLFVCSNVIKKDWQKLYNFLTSKEALDLFKVNTDDNTQQQLYDFSLLYERHHYYKNPIIENKFIIEEMAKQDKLIFHHISEELINDNQFIGKLFFEHGAEYNPEEEDIEGFSNKIYHFGSFEKYLESLLLEYKLNQDLVQKQSKKKRKI